MMRPLYHPSPLGIVFATTVLVLLGAGTVFLRGVIEFLGTSATSVLGSWLSRGVQ
jgi:hypothetical protein